MLNRSQWITIFGLARRGEGPIPYASRDIRQHLLMTDAADFDPEGDIAELLSFIAYGNLAQAKMMLDANPRLVLLAGHTDTPSGLNVLHTTPLECALGAGDPEMVAMIAPYFDKFDGGAKVREDQFARYRQHIEDMLKPEKNLAYDFGLLVDTLIAASPEDVMASLNLDNTHESVLRDVLAQFRIDFTPDTNRRGMHVNYLHLLQAIKVYNERHDALLKNADNDDCKLQLFLRQIIGFIQRSLPAIDRMVFAQGLFMVAHNDPKIPRSFKVYLSSTHFPVASDTELGYERWVLGGVNTEFFGLVRGAMGGVAQAYEKVLQRKHDWLVKIVSAPREENTYSCVIC